MRQLAILGGHPAFAEPLHVGRPNVGSEEQFLALTQQVLASRRFTNYGPLVAQFERQISERLQVEHCVVVNNATSGLALAAIALGLSGSVIVPAFGFIATAHAMRLAGLRVLFADIDPRTHHIDCASVLARIEPDTSAVVAVHLWGNPCDIAPLEQLCEERGMKLLFDSAQAFGSTCDGVPVGGFGNAEVFSFHATKAINSFEGGAITTRDAALADKLRLLVNFGFAGEDQIDSWGINAKMPEVCAAMGITSLASADAIFAHNLRIHDAYAAHLRGTEGLALLPYPRNEANSRNYVVLTVTDAFPLDRDALYHVLRAENVLARRYFNPAGHQAEPYRHLSENRRLTLPATERACREVLCLPTGTSITIDQVQRICEIIASAGEQAAAIRDAHALPEERVDAAGR